MNWTLLQNSLLVAGLATLASLAAGIAAAAAAAGLSRPARLALTGAGMAVFALPPFLVTNAWLDYFGLAGSWRQYLDFNVYSLTGTVLLLSLQLWPIAFILLLGRFLQVERSWLEQEPLLRGHSFRARLLWPISRPALAQSAVLIFVLALNNFAVPTLLQVKVYPAEIWLSFNTRFDYLEALWLSWPMILAPLLLLAFFRSRPVRFPARNRGFAPGLFRSRLGGAASGACRALTALLLLASLALPLFQLVSSPRTWTELMPAFSAGTNAFGNSFLFAACTALLVLGAGILLRRFRWPAASWILLLVPGVLLGIALVYLLNRPWLGALYHSTALVTAAYALRFLALGWAAARIVHLESDPLLRDAARSLGANQWQRFRLAEWPRGKALILGAGAFVYLLCLWDVGTLIFIVPPGRETLALRIFNMLHYGHAAQVNALCVWLLVLAFAPLAAFALWRVIRRRPGAAVLAILPLFLAACTPAPGSRAIQTDLFTSVDILGSRGTGAGQFNKPRSLALDGRDNLYVVDLTGRVQKFSPDGQVLLSWQMPETRKGKPKGMLGLDEGIILIEPHYFRVNHFSAAGELLRQWGRHGTNRGELAFPRSIGMNSHGELYISEFGVVERVQRFSPGGKEFLGSFGEPGTGTGQFNRAETVAIAPDDRVYVADSCNHRVQVFSREGEFLTAFGKPGSGPGEMSYPYDVRIDARGNVFVCEFGNSRIQIFNREHESIGMVGGSGLEPGQLNNPWSIDLDSKGNLWVADSGNHRVQKFVRKEPLPSQSLEVTLAK